MARQEEITSPRDERILELFKENKLEGFNLIYSKYGGTEISVDGEDVLIMRADDLLAVLG